MKAGKYCTDPGGKYHPATKVTRTVPPFRNRDPIPPFTFWYCSRCDAVALIPAKEEVEEDA